ncbi:MAG TPA: M28 family peptidase, partial [Fimbriimonadaceae bacterium]|nr:M28 family peptidase [Fimbriimonadaceae bacterium]
MLTTVVASLALGLAVADAPRAVTISPSTIKSHLDYLTSEELGGRMTLSPGMKLFADYAAERFKRYGLSEGPNPGYFHYYETSANQRAGANNSAYAEANGRKSTLKLGEDFVPLIGSTNKKTVSGEVVFVGYGLEEENWSDYAGIDVKGKIVVALRGVPEGQRNRNNSAKARLASEKGATGIIFVGEGAGRASLPPLARGLGVPTSVETVAIAITNATFERLTGLKGATERSATKPNSRLLPVKVEMTTETEPNTGKAINVIGYLPGNDPVLKNEYIIIGAHFDHLGYAETGSRTGVPEMHPGADDNGSGSAGLLALAEEMSKSKGNRRTIIFQLYSGEEIGLQGSRAWVTDNPETIGKTMGMLNMDMIGSVRFNDIYVFGTSTSLGWDGLLDQVKVGDLNLVYRGHLRGDSDQASFGRRNVPSLFFHSMLTEFHHTEHDTIDKV